MGERDGRKRMGEKEVNKERKRIGERERKRERERDSEDGREREKERQEGSRTKSRSSIPPTSKFFNLLSPIFNTLFLLTVFFHHHGINIACCVFVFKG